MTDTAFDGPEIMELRQQIADLVGRLADGEFEDWVIKMKVLALISALGEYSDLSESDVRLAAELYTFIADQSPNKVHSYIVNWSQAAWVATLLAQSDFRQDETGR